MGCRALLLGIFPTQGSNLRLLYCQRILYQLSYPDLIFFPRAVQTQREGMSPPSSSCLFCEDTLKRCCRNEQRGGWESREWLHVHGYISRLLGPGSRWLKSRLANQTIGKRLLCLQLQTKFPPAMIMKHTQCIFSCSSWSGDSPAAHTLAQRVSVGLSWGCLSVWSPGSAVSFCCKYDDAKGDPVRRFHWIQHKAEIQAHILPNFLT